MTGSIAGNLSLPGSSTITADMEAQYKEAEDLELSCKLLNEVCTAMPALLMASPSADTW
jgi:hypothetical protein